MMMFMAMKIESTSEQPRMRGRETIMKAVMPPPHYYLAIAINSILVTRLELATTMMLMMTMCER